jgi:SpoVK/Ycf46/Vps4 family AAA+-type ATPase
LFARRTEIKDAHDRHANADTNYLLELIGLFDGAALLATNKKDNVDPAFIRRLRHVVDFPAPGRAERKALWERHIVALSDARLPPAKAAGWGERLAELELTPAQIKGAALSAAFLRQAAGRPAPLFPDFVAGVDRELAKDARGIDRQLRERLMRNG